MYDVRVVPKDDFPAVDGYGNTDTPELRLITCGGPVDSATRSYEDDLVVFARQPPDPSRTAPGSVVRSDGGARGAVEGSGRRLRWGQK